MSVSQIIVNARMADYDDMALAGMGVAMQALITNLSRQGLIYLPHCSSCRRPLA